MTDDTHPRIGTREAPKARHRYGARTAIVLVVVAAMVGSGCVGWRSHVDPHAAQWNPGTPSGSGPKRLQLTLNVEHANIPQKDQEDIVDRYRKDAVKYLAKNAWLSEVGTNVAAPDLELVLNIKEEEHFSIGMVWVSALTALIWPVVDRVEITGTGEVFDGSGQSLGRFDVEESVSVAISLLAFPLIPTAFTAVSASRADIMKSVSAQMERLPGVRQ